MMLPRIDDVQIEACLEFAKGVARDDSLTKLCMNAINATRLMTASKVGETIDAGVMAALSGQISLCNWFENILRQACEEREAEAKVAVPPQFLKGGASES